MPAYFRNLDKIEFTITMACTGSCKHCSEGDHSGMHAHIDAQAAADAVRKVCAHYPIRTLMTFGGEPLLYPETVCAIHQTAFELGIATRQVITNGYFSAKPERIRAVAKALKESGVNDLRLSVDAFHQEFIPLEPVFLFAQSAAEAKLPVFLQPAWLVSAEDKNPYNCRTRELLQKFEPLQIPQHAGNVIFPTGNARKYLSEYFDENQTAASPYEQDPNDIRTLSFDPDGTVLNGNIYQTDILEILARYQP